MPMEFIRERNFDSKGINLTAKEWGRSGYLPVIALHGWLDNAASFDRMLPHMDNLHVVALDLAGHGPSGHRSEDSGYDIWSDIADVMAVADQMGWDTFALLGHSRGAIISGLVAGTFPDRISHAVLIDGYVPTPVDDGNSAKQLAKAIHENKRFGQASPTAFRDFEHAVQARTSGILPLEPEAAAILAARGVVETDRGFCWNNDQRLKAASHVKFGKAQLESFFTAVTARTLLIAAEGSLFSPAKEQAFMLPWIPQMQVLKMQGSHHLHLEGQAEEVAKAVQTFLG